MHALELLTLVMVSALWGGQYLLLNKSLSYLNGSDLAIARTFVAIPLLVVAIAIQNRLGKCTSREASKDKDSLRVHSTRSSRRNSVDHSVSTRSRISRVSNRSKVQDWSSPKVLMKSLTQFAIVGVLCQGFGIFTCIEAGKGFSSGVMGILFCLEPIVAAASAVVLRIPNSKLTKLSLFGMIVSMLGISMVVYPNLVTGQNQIGDSGVPLLLKVWYILAGLLSPAFYGFGAMVNKIFMSKNPAPVLVCVTGQTFFGLVYLFFQSCVINAVSGKFVFQSVLNIAHSEATVWIYLIVMSLTSSVICWGLFLWLLKRIGARASLYAFLVPCIALLLGALLNHEWEGVSIHMIMIQLIGVVIVLGGMSLVMMERFFTALLSGSGGNADKVVDTYLSASVMSVYTAEEEDSEFAIEDNPDEEDTFNPLLRSTSEFFPLISSNHKLSLDDYGSTSNNQE